MSEDGINPHRGISGVMQMIAWLVFLALAGFYFSDLLERQHNPNQNLQTFAGGDVREVTLKRNRLGHYVASGAINGQPVVFILDTGATGVAIPEGIARRLQLSRGRPYPTQTANGTGIAYHAELTSVSVGDIRLNGVAASISPGLQMDEVLLGMSFLRHIEFSQRGDSLILRQRL